jgi:cell shape-determining protein MreD
VNRIVLRWLNAPGLVLLTLIGVALQTSLFNSYPFNYLQPDVVLIAVFWCALRRDFAEGGILTLIFGEITEVHTAAPSGLFLISYMVVFLLGRLAARYLVIPNLSSMVLLTMAASASWKLTYIFVLYLLGESSNQWRHLIVLLLPGAVTAGVASIWLYRGLERFDRLTFKDPHSRASIDDELELDPSDGLERGV